MLRNGQILFLCALALLTLGVLMVTSAGMQIAPASADQPIRGDGGLSPIAIMSGRTGIYAALALFAMGAAAFMPARFVNSAIKPRPDKFYMMLCIGTAVLVGSLLLVYLPGIAREKNFSSRWIEIPAPVFGTLSIQPSELVKWSMLGLLAWCAVSAGDRLRQFWRGLVPMLIALGMVSAVIMKEDLGTAVLVGATGVIVLLAAGAKFWHIGVLAPAGLGVVAAGLLTSDYRMKRVTSFIDPYADPAGDGFHIIQSMGAIANGEGVGRGLGHGLQKFGYLPEDTTDFIFAIISEELGLFGVALVLFLYCVLLTTGVDIAKRDTRPVARLFVLGVIATIGLQACINLLVVTKLAPTKGIALPLISSGGTGWILTSAALGMLIRFDRSQAAGELGCDDIEPEDADEDAEPVGALA
ncbi:MAG: FtsW/RodA/SpoVE family cell cycle protein [Phycisphaerales bacterium JB061]